MKNQPIHSVLFHLLLTFVYQHNVLATNNELKLSHDIQGLYKQQIAIKNRLKELNHHAYHQKSIYKQLTDTIYKQKDTLSDNTSLIFKKSAFFCGGVLRLRAVAVAQGRRARGKRNGRRLAATVARCCVCRAM